MSKKEQIEAIKSDIDVFENAPTIYFASDTHITKVKLIVKESDRQELIERLKQKIKDLEKEQDDE
jgi:hypothetical protein